MSATDELRRLLDERGVEYEVDDAKTVRVTRWGAYGDWVSFIEYDNGDTKFCIDARRLTPEQAIAATLGDSDETSARQGDADLAAENARLKQELETVGVVAYLYGRTDLATENARLREEAERAWRTAERLCQAFDGPCRDDGTTIYKPCPMGERDEECVYGQLQRDLRELGVEVEK